MSQHESVSLDETDLLLLDVLQDDVPLIPNPWKVIGERVGISGDEVLLRLTRLVDNGYLKGIVPTLESAQVRPLVSTLVALRAPDDKIRDVASVVNTYPEVSHNYRRNHEYNLWFTLAAPSHKCIEEIINEILNKTGLSSDDMLNLYTEKKYKIDVRFPILNNYDDSS